MSRSALAYLRAASLPTTRHFSNTPWLRTPYTEHVQVPCASSGHVTVSLHDVAKHSSLSPLVINLPSFPVQDIDAVPTYLPRFLHHYPSATIHYRWPQQDQPSIQDKQTSPSSPPDETQSLPPVDRWPTPIHDTLAGYDYLTRTLTPPPSGTNGHSQHQRRAIFVCGRHLGAGLAASLALTESHSHEPMAIRGLLAMNGVYNWTTFLPDHPVNTTRLAMQHELCRLGLDPGSVYTPEGSDIAMMKELLPRLFHRPGDLFDPFASPLLFFHTAGLMVPPSFTERWQPDYFADKLVSSTSSPSSRSSASNSGSSAVVDPHDYVYSDPEDPYPPTPVLASDADGEARAPINPDADDMPLPFIPPPARKGYLAFPPRTSTLKIPDSLFIHSAAPPSAIPLFARRTALWKKFRNAENSFKSQAIGLAGLMRRSVDKLEARERMRWDEDFVDPAGEAGRRVETGEVRVGEDGLEDEAEAEEMARQWFEDHLG